VSGAGKKNKNQRPSELAWALVLLNQEAVIRAD
jgi:hypothetical protein